MSTRTSSSHTAAAALVYWLMVMCGLAGLSVLRMNTPREFVPLWIGSVAGVGLGQTLAWLRLRVWLIAVMSIVAIAASPIVFAVLCMMFGSFDISLETCVLAFAPAAVCGYLSLSERAGLIAFWYPAMLWMVVILDRPSAAAFDLQNVLPLVAGLGGLFVVFLRSRETRHTAIWGAHSTLRLAEPLSRTVLRTSPLRGASQHLWTGAVGIGSLLLAAWVAPHLWQKEAAHPYAAAVPLPLTEDLDKSSALAPDGDQCCTSDDVEEQRRERVREYFPLKRTSDTEARRAARPPCTRCQSGGRARTTASGAKGITSGSASRGYGKYGSSTGNGWSGDTTPSPAAAGYDGAAGAGTATAYGPGGYGTDGYGGGYVAPEPPAPDPIPEVTPLPPAPPMPKGAKPAYVPKPDLGAPKPEAKVEVEAPPMVTPASAISPTPMLLTPPPAGPSPAKGGVPWRSGLALCIGGMALHLAMRAARRQLTLRHLARPFWRETFDQRVSNQWQRMLIGLRDAGIHPTTDEQPQALAKRVGIDGMATCATILERVRHGVRVDAADLVAMDAASAAVYRAARDRAGATARAAALVRSPL